MSDNEMVQATQPRHPIQVVARRTGLNADVIRAWERRHSAVLPKRTETGRRLYSDADAERLALLRQATENGRRIGDVAAVATDVLRTMVAADIAARAISVPARPRTIASPEAKCHIETAMEAVRCYDAAGIERALREAHLLLGLPRVLVDVVAPLLEQIGEGWRDNTLRVAHEHVASAEIRTFLGGLLGSCTNGWRGPRAVVATPIGQVHELGALMCALVVANAGWKPVYMGPNLPADSIAVAARQCDACAIVLSICFPADDRLLDDELRRLGAQVAPTTSLLAGGIASEGYADALADAGAEHIGSLGELHATLDRIRASGQTAGGQTRAT